ncbi:hypothetical protein [Streptomyces ipomoeae]|uniref:hypothetical protein n=1 Tax=Streptomyces ipomoeae TaxID=103232 RepID=UPI001C67936B|nr:hypothetical protein [Streptomyces ipomoeae]
MNAKRPTPGPFEPARPAPGQADPDPGRAPGAPPAPDLRTRLRALRLPLIGGLTAIALVRPLFSVVGLSDALGKPVTPLVLTAVISLAWIVLVGLRRVPEPVLTLVAAGVAYSLAAVVLSGILSPILLGRLEGPLARPYAIVPMTVFNAVWGAVCGLLALAVQSVVSRRARRQRASARRVDSGRR